jgi:hypothetical protein
MSFTNSIFKFLTNKKALNIIFTITVLNLIGYLVTGNIQAFIFFNLTALVVGKLTKNIAVTLLITLFVVNLYVLGKKTKEAMTNLNSSDETQTNNNNSTQDASGNSLQKTIQKINDKASTNKGLPITPIDNSNNNVDTKNTTTEESFEVGRNKKAKYDIDYASTIEDAYDELNKIIGGDGIKKLTGDTQNLMKQQMQLAEAMKSMGPLIEQMGPLMQSVGPMLEQAKGIMGSSSNGIADLAKNFSAGAK